jgi:hypothetical protein
LNAQNSFQYKKYGPAVHGYRLSIPRLYHTGRAACNIPYRFMVSMPNRFVKMKTITLLFLLRFSCTAVYITCTDNPATLAIKHGFTCDLKGMHGRKSMVSNKMLHFLRLHM